MSCSPCACCCLESITSIWWSSWTLWKFWGSILSQEKEMYFYGSEAIFIPSTLTFKLLLAWLQSELDSGWDSEEPPQFLGVSSCWLETCDLADFIRLGFTSLALSWGLLQAWISPKEQLLWLSLETDSGPCFTLCLKYLPPYDLSRSREVNSRPLPHCCIWHH